jgi:hypothetical protein
VAPGHDVAPVHLRHGLAGDRPALGGHGGDVVPDRLHELLALAEIAVARLAAVGGWVTAAPGHQRAAIDAPALRGQVHEHLARGRRHLAQLRGHDRRRAAAERAHVERRQRRVRHDHRDRPTGNPQLLGTTCDSDVRMFWPTSALPVKTLTRPSSPMWSQAETSRAWRRRARASGFLGGRGGQRERNHEPGSEHLEEVAAGDLEPIGGSFEELVALGFDDGGASSRSATGGPRGHEGRARTAATMRG